MDRSDREWQRAVNRCGSVAVALYFEQLGKTVRTEQSVNVKVLCWPTESSISDPERWAEGPDSRIDFVNVVVDAEELSATDWRANRRSLVRWFHLGLLRAADHWGWSPEPFYAALAGVEATGYDLVWRTATKASPDRRHRAVGVAQIDEQGGATRLEVMDRDGSVVVTVDGGPLRLPQVAEAKLRLKSITWVDAEHVVLRAGSLFGNVKPEYDAIEAQVPSSE
jgi:hypothetical protein